MARRRSRSQLDAMDQINITPLLDLTFLLLIVFMISMPLMQFSLDISSPEVNASPPPEEHSYEVGLNRDGEIVFRNAVISKEALLRELTRIFGSDPEAIVLLNGDESRAYGDVIGLYRMIRNAGFTSIKLITRPE